MAGIIQTLDGPVCSDEEASLHYAIYGAANAGDAYATALAGSPAVCTVSGIVLYRSRPFVELTPLTPDSYKAKVNYKSEAQQKKDDDNKQAGDNEFSFEFSTQHARRTWSRHTVSRTAAAGQVAPDFGGAIGVTDKGVEGCDIDVPAGGFTEKWTLSETQVTDAYKRLLLGMVGKANLGAWRGWQTYELLFGGASGTSKGDGLWQVTYHFRISPQADNLAICNGRITVPRKCGWDYVWIRSKETIITVDGVKVLGHVPVAAYVEEIYEGANFAQLEIGS